jgi:hypothetical protein
MYSPLSPPPSLTLLTEFFSRMINPFPSFQTHDEAMKGGRMKTEEPGGQLKQGLGNYPRFV